MQHFDIARQYMSKSHHFSHVMMLHFYFGRFQSWFYCYVQKQVRPNIHVMLKAHMPNVIYFYGIQFGQQITKI